MSQCFLYSQTFPIVDLLPSLAICHFSLLFSVKNEKRILNQMYYSWPETVKNRSLNLTFLTNYLVTLNVLTYLLHSILFQYLNKYNFCYMKIHQILYSQWITNYTQYYREYHYCLFEITELFKKYILVIVYAIFILPADTPTLYSK